MKRQIDDPHTDIHVHLYVAFLSLLISLGKKGNEKGSWFTSFQMSATIGRLILQPTALQFPSG